MGRVGSGPTGVTKAAFAVTYGTDGTAFQTRLVVRADPAYNERMEISFAPELEARLNRIASQTGKGPDEVVRELVASYLDHDEWFRHQVEQCLASLD